MCYKKIAICIVFMGLAMNAFADTLNQAAMNSIQFEVIQERFVFDKATVDEASIIVQRDGAYRGLHIKLKPNFASFFERMTASGTRKQANIIFNNKIVSRVMIQSRINGDLMMTGISREDAQIFIDSLNQRQPRPAATFEGQALSQDQAS